MNNKFILSGCVISIFLVWMMYIRKNWPPLIHVQATEDFNASTLSPLLDILCLCFYSKPIWLLCEPLVANCFGWKIPHQNHQKLQKSCVERNFLLPDTETSQGAQPKILFFISSLCSFFWFSSKQDVTSSNAFLRLLKIPLAGWSKKILSFAGIHFPPNRYLLFIY